MPEQVIVTESTDESGPAVAHRAEPAPAQRATEAHQEWLLDESLAETFPASDPISPA
jgi:hypothetical protein